MSVSLTGYLVNGMDLSNLFLPRVSTDPKGKVTGFTVYNSSTVTNVDINELFYPYSDESGLKKLTFNTNMLTSEGADLSSVFAAGPPFYTTATGGNVSGYDASSNYYSIVFTNANTLKPESITFTRAVKNLYITAVGGGGGGGGGLIVQPELRTIYYYSGGGGQGGFSSNYMLESVPVNTTYKITVGKGGAAGKTQRTQTNRCTDGREGSPSIVTDSSGPIVTANGGKGGKKRKAPENAAQGGGVFGETSSGGSGGTILLNSSEVSIPTDGISGYPLTIYPDSPTYNFGGGGAGGLIYNNPEYTPEGGLGGGAGWFNAFYGFTSVGNAIQSYTGPNGIFYETGSFSCLGWPNTGGGGCGLPTSGGNIAVDKPFGRGGSGIVIVCFQDSLTA